MNRRNTTLGAVISLVVILALLGVAWLATRPHQAAAPAATHATTVKATTRSSGGHTTARPGGEGTDSQTGLPWIAESALPKEGRDTLALIDKGGPFPYPNNDGVVFTNAEGHLPKHPSGYYHEYTVPTPGSRDRGARRIVTGGPGEYFYTDDHYDSFSRIKR